MFEGLFKTAPTVATPKVTAPTPGSGGSGLFSGLFDKTQTPAPSATSQPVQPVVKSPNAKASLAPDIPATALQGSLGGGYGASNVTDKYSAKPLLTYENPEARSSQLLSNRVAPKFDPTVPQKVAASTLHTERMPQAASQAVRQETGSTSDEQLDHLISLELGGSNATENLNNEKVNDKGVQPSLTMENQLAKDVVSGKISYIDAQKKIAEAKGVKLADDSNFDNTSHPLAAGYPKPAPNQQGTQAQQPNIFQKAGNVIKGVVDKGKDVAENLITNFAPFKQLALLAGGESFYQSFKDSMKGQTLNSDDLDRATARVQELVKGGMSKQDAAKQALTEARNEKNKATVAASVGPSEDLIAEDVLSALAKETNLGKIAATLTSKGVGEDAASAIAPILSKANTPEAVKGILQTASEHGLLDVIPKQGLTAAEEFAQQESEKGGTTPTPTDDYKIVSDDNREAFKEFSERNPNNKALPAPEESISAGEKETAIKPEENKPILPEATHVDDIPNSDESSVKIPNEKVPVIREDAQTLEEAATKTVAGKGMGLKGMDKETSDIYKDWVNQAGQSNKAISGRIAARPFESLRDEGMNAVHQFQSGDRAGKLGDVEKWGKDILTKEQAAGIPVEARANYLPQYWANTPAEVQAAYQKYFGHAGGGSVSLNPAFAKSAVFPDYATGEAYGLKPKYDNIPDIINARVRASEKALADRKFFEDLTKHNLLQPRGGQGWKQLDPDRFPKYKVIGADGKPYQGPMRAPAPLADLINNQIKGPESGLDRGFQTAAKWATKLKGVVLSTGIPGTGINPHGFNELAATVPELLNKPGLFTSALKYMVYPKAGGDFINENLEMAQEAARSGLVLGGEDFTLNPANEAAIMKGMFGKAEEYVDKGLNKLYSVFGKNLFEKVIPALKLDLWDDTKKFLMDQGLSEADAGKEAASIANKTFGGLNYAALGRDKNVQNFWRVAILAPDFWESRFSYAADIGRSLAGKGPAAKLYQKAAMGILGAYIAMNLANKERSGKWMYENPAGHSMDVYGGKDSAGKDVWVRPFGTDLDFIRLPMDLAASALQGNFSPLGTDLRNRVSALAQPVVSFISNSDAYGNKLFTNSSVQNPASKQILNYIATLPIIPSSASSLAGLLNPMQSKAQSLSQAAGLPLRFNASNSDAVKSVADMIYTERPLLQSEIKKVYAAGGDTQGEIDKMAQFNKALLAATIQSYKDNGYKVDDLNQFTHWLVNTTQKNGGLKGLFLKPPSATSIKNTQDKTGKPLFGKIFGH